APIRVAADGAAAGGPGGPPSILATRLSVVPVGYAPSSQTRKEDRLMSEFPGLAHVAVTVKDVEVSGPWYRKLLDADPVLDEHTDAGFRHLVWVLDGGTLFGIHQHERGVPDERFTEFRVGLDHVGFGVASRADLEKWVEKLNELGI